MADLTQEEINQINKDIKDNTDAVNEKAKADAVAKAKVEAKGELLQEQKLQSLESQVKELNESKQKLETDYAKKLEDMKTETDKRFDDLASSKQTINNEDPFGKKQANVEGKDVIDKLDDFAIKDIEEQSKEAFFGRNKN